MSEDKRQEAYQAAAEAARKEIGELKAARARIAQKLAGVDGRIAGLESIIAMVDKPAKPRRSKGGASKPRYKLSHAIEVLKAFPAGLSRDDLCVELEKKFGYKPNPDSVRNSMNHASGKPGFPIRDHETRKWKLKA